MTQRDEIAAALAPVLDEQGLELFDVELSGSGRARVLRVFVDRDGGVDLDAVAAASEAVSSWLDRDPGIARSLPGPYSLEVSSPGLERPLRTPAHFRRAVGSTVSVKTRDAQGHGVRRRGVLVDADDDGIVLDTDGEAVRVALHDILQARTVFDWDQVLKVRAVGREVSGHS
jgi:ribosome maturation factor RimP